MCIYVYEDFWFVGTSICVSIEQASSYTEDIHEVALLHGWVWTKEIVFSSFPPVMSLFCGCSFCVSVCMQFTLIDNNATHDDDALYGSESLSLDALTHTTMTRLRNDDKLVDPLDYIVTFDEPMGQGM